LTRQYFHSFLQHYFLYLLICDFGERQGTIYRTHSVGVFSLFVPYYWYHMGFTVYTDEFPPHGEVGAIRESGATSAGVCWSSTYYIYNSENMLTSSWGQASLSYDPLQRLFQVSGATTTRLLYDNATLIAEYDSGNSLLRRYVHGPGVDEPLVCGNGDMFFFTKKNVPPVPAAAPAGVRRRRSLRATRLICGFASNPRAATRRTAPRADCAAPCSGRPCSSP
jgi:hypothetical protein